MYATVILAIETTKYEDKHVELEMNLQEFQQYLDYGATYLVGTRDGKNLAIATSSILRIEWK